MNQTISTFNTNENTLTNSRNRTARFAAIDTLHRLTTNKTSVRPIFEKVAEDCRLSSVERGLAKNIVYGVLRNRQYLESLLTSLCRRPLKKLDPLVYHALCVGVYQLCYLDRIPQSAAVNETVNGVKAAGLPRYLHGFVNGVLREFIRQKGQLHPDTSQPEDNQHILNHPDWLTRRWQHRFGREEMERICRINNTEPCLVLRTNTLLTDRQQLLDMIKQAGIAVQPGEYAPESLVLPGYNGSVTQLPGYQQGWFQVQDEAAQLATLLLAPFSGAPSYLDVCAGLGGKTSHMLECCKQENQKVVAVEPSSYRFTLLQENLIRLAKGRSVELKNTTIEEYAIDTNEHFSRVLVDAPCSGTGVTGRHPDIRWSRTEEELQRYQQTQFAILSQSAAMVAPTGVLVYATCSLESEENEAVVERFIASREDYILTDCRSYLPPEAMKLVRQGYFNPHPNRSIDGFFAARLERRA